MQNNVEAAKARAMRPATMKAEAKMELQSSMHQGGQRVRSLREIKGAVGLMNSGNSCYMNATIQALSHCPPFRQYLTDHFSARSGNDLVSNVVAELLRKMWTVPRQVHHLSSRSISSNMKQKIFKGYGQQDAQEFLRCLLSQIHDELQLESLVGNTHESSTMSLNSSSSSSNSSQTQLVTASDQPHPPVLSSTSGGIKDSPILRSLSRKNQKLQSSRQEITPDTFEPTSVVSVEDICVVERISHCITLHKPLAKISDQPKECMDYHMQQPKDMGWSDSERSLIEEGAPVCSSDHQPLHPDRESEGARQSDKVQDMETTQDYDKVAAQDYDKVAAQDYDKVAANAATVKKRILEEANKKKITQYHSIVTEVFEGKVESKVKCLSCQKVSVTVESFQDLSLPIPGRKELSKVAEDDSPRSKWCNLLSAAKEFTYDVLWGPPTTLQNCLSVFFDTSELRGDNRYYCEHCKSFQNSQKSMKIIQLPEVLCIHLKRFRFDAFFSTKISRTINFPLTGLNMTPYLKDAAQNSTLCTNYELISFISHLGNAGGGHYVTYARNEDTNMWLEYNDSSVSVVPLTELQRKEGYVFFFRCASSTAAMTQQRIEQLSCLSTDEQQQSRVYISRHWLSLYYHCSVPGPIFSNDFACSHGAIWPYPTHRRPQDWCQAVPEVIGNRLFERFGGSPPVKELQQCQLCMNQLQEYKRRREKELSEIRSLQAKDHHNLDYYLSMDWVLKWQRFIHGKTLDETPPPPINNFPLIRAKDKKLMLNTAVRSKQVSKNIWDYFQSIYSGGPAITLSQSF